MTIAGLIVTLLGFVVSLLGLGFSTSASVRLLMAVAGIVISLFGIIGLLNPAFVKTANWKR